MIDLFKAHHQSGHNRNVVLASERCGCFACESVFASRFIRDWCDDGHTALCPLCGVDAIIGSASGIVLTDAFLTAMRVQFFSENPLRPTLPRE
jgi:hypothetical protein